MAAVLFFAIPDRARAGFFSNIVEFFAGREAAALQPETGAASVSLPLLGSAAGSTATDSSIEEDDGEGNNNIPLSTTQDNALVAPLNPLGTMPTDAQDEIIEYTVKPGETASAIAAKFDISLNTLLWANNLSGFHRLKAGDLIVILPVPGVKYTIKKGDTLDALIKKFKPKGLVQEADILSFKADILAFNGLAINEPLKPGALIIIPDGEIAELPSSPLHPRGLGTRLGGALPDLKGYFLRPILGGRKTRGIHGFNGVDLADSCGLPVLASADGTVIRASASGWNGGYGKFVVVAHANGAKTLYAHLSSLLARVGEVVIRGSEVGGIGSTGNSTGCHVHFEIRGAKNPF